jgi:predicted nucleotidyltransferase
MTGMNLTSEAQKPAVHSDLPRFIPRIAARLLRCGAQEVLLFGSYAKGQQNRDSDVDIMVIFSGPVSQSTEYELRDLTGSSAIRIDLHALSCAKAYAGQSDPTSFLGSCLSAAKSLALTPGRRSILIPERRTNTRSALERTTLQA